jgi:hypothetical protein
MHAKNANQNFSKTFGQLSDIKEIFSGAIGSSEQILEFIRVNSRLNPWFSPCLGVSVVGFLIYKEDISAAAL